MLAVPITTTPTHLRPVPRQPSGVRRLASGVWCLVFGVGGGGSCGGVDDGGGAVIAQPAHCPTLNTVPTLVLLLLVAHLHGRHRA